MSVLVKNIMCVFVVSDECDDEDAVDTATVLSAQVCGSNRLGSTCQFKFSWLTIAPEMEVTAILTIWAHEGAQLLYTQQPLPG